MREKRVRTANLHARLLPERLEKLRQLAASERRTVTQMLEELIVRAPGPSGE